MSALAIVFAILGHSLAATPPSRNTDADFILAMLGLGSFGLAISFGILSIWF